MADWMASYRCRKLRGSVTMDRIATDSDLKREFACPRCRAAQAHSARSVDAEKPFQGRDAISSLMARGSIGPRPDVIRFRLRTVSKKKAAACAEEWEDNALL